MTKTKFKQVDSDEWQQPIRRGYLMKCCDCGLIHKLDFRLYKQGKNRRKIQFRVYRVKMAYDKGNKRIIEYYK